MPEHNLLAAVRETLEDLEGSYALAVLVRRAPNQFVAARKDSPLIVGLGQGCNYIASDIPAILARTRDVLIMEDREVVLVTATGIELYDEFGRPVVRSRCTSPGTAPRPKRAASSIS
jgi:glutamine---fructose-6-phosphate transaminase (isomerizing)